MPGPIYHSILSRVSANLALLLHFVLYPLSFLFMSIGLLLGHILGCLLSKDLGFSRKLMGILLVLMPMTSFFGGLFWSAVVDHTGSYRGVLTSTSVLGIVAIFGYLLPQIGHSLPLLLVITLLHGFLDSLIMAAYLLLFVICSVHFQMSWAALPFSTAFMFVRFGPFSRWSQVSDSSCWPYPRWPLLKSPLGAKGIWGWRIAVSWFWWKVFKSAKQGFHIFQPNRAKKHISMLNLRLGPSPHVERLFHFPYFPVMQEDYGDQRLWSAVGWGTMAFVAGKLVDPLGALIL